MKKTILPLISLLLIGSFNHCTQKMPIENQTLKLVPLPEKVEQLYENGDLITGASTTGSGVVKSEKVGDRSVTYDVGVSVTTNETKFLGIPEEAEVILKKYRNLFYKAVI